MKFIKLHRNGKELLVNLNNIAEVHITKDNKSLLYFNFEIGGEPVSAPVDESLDEILELMRQVSV